MHENASRSAAADKEDKGFGEEPGAEQSAAAKAAKKGGGVVCGFRVVAGLDTGAGTSVADAGTGAAAELAGRCV